LHARLALVLLAQRLVDGRLWNPHLKSEMWGTRPSLPPASGLGSMTHHFSGSLRRPINPTMPTPRHAPQPVSPTMSAPCSIWMRGWPRYRKRNINPISKTARLANRLRVCMRPLWGGIHTRSYCDRNAAFVSRPAGGPLPPLFRRSVAGLSQKGSNLNIRKIS
jgi:hypothetical protein